MLRISRVIAGIYLLATILMATTTVIFGPIGWSPFPLAAAAPPIRVELAVSSEKEAWIRSALERFAQTNPNINGRRIEVRFRVAGSRGLIEAIEREGYQPTAISPASMIQIDELRQIRPDLLRDSVSPLVFSPIVALMRDAQSTAGITNPWLLWQRELPDQAKAVKVGISSPVSSNGGLQTLIVLAAQYHQTTQLNVSQVRDSGFRDWLRQLKVPAWPDSTGTLTTDFVIRPGVYDIITTYESLALQVFRQAEGRFLEVRVYYPEATLLSDHPFTILTAPWVDSAERAAALRLRDFLLSPAEQTIAMREFGFRPVIPQVTINLDDQDSLFGRYRDLGLQLDLKTQLENPSQAVVEALISTWQDVFNQ